MADSRPRNRAQRRQAAHTGSPIPKTEWTTSFLDQTTAGIPLAQPDRSGPKAKTLYDLAAERQTELQKEGFYAREAKEPLGSEGEHQFMSTDDDAPIGPLGDALVYTISLGMLHFTLDVLVFQQYRQEILWREIFEKTGKILPGLFFVIWSLHSKTANRVPWLRQLFFLASSVAAGCCLIHSGNLDGYYAVMKRAPGVGTLWIWGVVEMDLWWCLANVVIVGGYMWWNGFSAF